MSSLDALFVPLKVGAYDLQHRVVMAPLTRQRGDDNLCATDLMCQYYAERASPGGLIISEATFIAPQSIACRHIPGCFNQEQAEAWGKVNAAVQAKAPGAVVSAQLWHQGRVAHHSYSNHPLALAAGAHVCEGPSPIAPDPARKSWTFEGIQAPYDAPKEMTADDITRVVSQFVEGARLALEVAGFQIVELHGAHQYLLDQFFNDSTNKRTDEFGGSFENRFRLTQLILDALVDKYPGRVAIRISPHLRTEAGMGIYDSNPEALYTYIMQRLAAYNLAYVLITEPRWVQTYTGNVKDDPGFDLPLVAAPFARTFRTLNKHTALFAAGGFAPLSAYECAELNQKDPVAQPYDGIAFGRFFISCPDLVFRLKHKLPLTMYDRTTFYNSPPFPPERVPLGYVDYPTFKAQVEAKFPPGVGVDEVIKSPELIQKLVELTQGSDQGSDKPEYKLVSIEQIGKIVD